MVAMVTVLVDKSKFADGIGVLRKWLGRCG